MIVIFLKSEGEQQAKEGLWGEGRIVSRKRKRLKVSMGKSQLRRWRVKVRDNDKQAWRRPGDRKGWNPEAREAAEDHRQTLFSLLNVERRVCDGYRLRLICRIRGLKLRENP